MIAIDLNKQEALDADPNTQYSKWILLEIYREKKTFFIIKNAKEAILSFSEATVKVL